jgi:hypothetical protein
MSVGGGNSDDIKASVNEGPDMAKDALTVEFTESVTSCGDRRSAEQAELGVTGWLELRLPFLRDLLHIAHGDQTVKSILVIHDK